MDNKNIKIGFFGTPEYAAMTLERLRDAGYTISFVVTNPDRPKGRGLVMTASPAKVWAEKNGVPVIQPESLRKPDSKEADPAIVEELKSYTCDVFVVIAYGKIIPEEVLNIPPHKSLNIHGSLLPKLRGASPIETAILEDMKETGVTIMRMDSLLDHGPILAQKKVTVEPWPPTADRLGWEIVAAGADTLAEILPEWVAGRLPEIEQDHTLATSCRKIAKEDAELDLTADPYKNFLKIQAYHGWPQAYFFADESGKKVRIKVLSATFTDSKLNIERVVPEGGKEMSFSEYQSRLLRS